MTESSINIILSRLDAIQDDVTYIRGRADQNTCNISDIKVDLSRVKGERAVTRYVTALIVPAIVALITTGLALAFGQ